MEHKDLAFVILIGGASSRFGSDKGLFEFKGIPLVSYQINAIKNFKKKIVISTHSKSQKSQYIERIPELKEHDFVFDDNKIAVNLYKRTPLLGFSSALEFLSENSFEKGFFLSCDMPFIKKEVIELMLKESSKNLCTMPRWNNLFLEPLFAIYPVNKTLENVKKNLRHNIFKLSKILDDSWNINYISIESIFKPIDEDLSSFININYIDDLTRFLD